MLSTVKRLWAGEEGQGMAEYGLILALVAVVVAAAQVTLQGGISSALETVNTKLGGAAATP